MFRLALRLAALFVILTAFSRAVRLDSTSAQAQTSRETISTDANAALPSSSAARTSPSAASVSFPTSAQAHAPIVVATGAQYANVRALARDMANGLYISLSSTPAPKNCVSSTATPPTRPNTASTPVPLTLTIFSNCAVAPSEDPYGIAVAPGNKIYLANRAQNTIRLLDMVGGKVSALPAGAVKNASQNQASSNVDPYQPAGLASDGQGNLYVADRGNDRVLGLAPGAAQFSFLAHVLDPNGLAVDAARGKVYAASPAANRVFVINLETGGAEVLAGSGTFTPTTNTTANSNLPSDPQEAQIGAPEGVAVDAQGNVFISDTEANAILRVDAKTGMLSRVSADDNLASPGALAIDRTGDVFVADRGNQRILEFPQLAAQATGGNVSLSPASFDFGDEPTGGTTSAQVFTLTNNSTSSLALANASFTLAGADPLDFAQTNNCVPLLSVGASCQISVTFTPAETAARSATLAVTDSDPSSPQTATLSGTGDTFSLTVPNVTNTTQSVAAGNNATYTISVVPDATFSGAVTLVCPRAFTSPAGESLAVANVTCSVSPATLSITPGQTQTFTVTLNTGGPNATRILPFTWRGGPDGDIRLLLLGFIALLLGLWSWRMRQAANRSMANFGGVCLSRRVRFATIGFALLASAALGGCGGSSSVNPNETPTSSYTLDITGTAQNASRSITLTLNVD